MIVVRSTIFPEKDRDLSSGEPVYRATKLAAAQQKTYRNPSHAPYVELPIVG